MRAAVCVGMAWVLGLAACGTPPSAYELAWQLDPAFSVGPADTTLHVLVYVDHCPAPAAFVDEFAQRKVEYRPGQIAISIGLRPGDCTISGAVYGLTVALDNPVGNRDIVGLGRPPGLPNYAYTLPVEYPATLPPESSP